MSSGVNSVSGTAVQSSQSAQSSKDLSAKTTEFESMLLEQLLNEVQKSFTSIGGESQDSASGTLSGIGTEALAKGLAERGGIGIAQMLRDHLPGGASS
jgi:Rod binding domain-containing protein